MMIITLIVLLVAVILLCNEIGKKTRKLSLLEKKYSELQDSWKRLDRYAGGIAQNCRTSEAETKRLENSLNELKGTYAKEIKDLRGRNNVLLAKCNFLEMYNKDLSMWKKSHYSKGKLISEVKKILKERKKIKYENIQSILRCHNSSLTYALRALVKKGMVKRVKNGWYEWINPADNIPDFPVK